MSPVVAALLADAILLLHVGLVGFVVLGTLAILAGGPLGWRWIRNRAFRLVHLGLMVFIAGQAWLGRLCPLTLWEQALRSRAGQEAATGSLIQHWLSELLFFDAPWWVFVTLYTVLAGALLPAGGYGPLAGGIERPAGLLQRMENPVFFAVSYWPRPFLGLHSNCRCVGQTTPLQTEQETWRRLQ